MASPNSPALQKLNNLDTSSPNFQDQLCNTLYGKEYMDCVQGLEGDDLTWLVNYLDKTLDVLENSCFASRKCLRELRNLCGKMRIVPTSYTLSSHLLDIHPQPFANGGSADVYHGTLDGSTVCIKRFRVYIQDDPEKVLKDFCREAVMWKRMVHPNVVPLLGIIVSKQPQLVSNWMSGGDLSKYIKKNPDVDRLALLCDVANGLQHLHSCNVIHGDLKGPNVVVDELGHARLVDFGLSMVTRNLDSMQVDSWHHRFTLRWSAPEVLRSWARSKEADVFSFGMVMYEVFTGTVPFSGKPEMAVVFEIMNGDRPPRPTHPAIAERLWSLMKLCWDNEPHLRPEISDALETLLNTDIPAKGGPIARALAKTSPSSAVLQKLRNLEMSSLNFQDQLSNVFYGKEYAECIRDLEGDDVTWLINFLDKAINILQPSGVVSQKCLRELRRICGNQGILPTSYTLSSRPLSIHRQPFASGGFGDVYQGTFDGSRVCIKHLRVSAQDDQKTVLRHLCQEAVMWKRMAHPNIVPLLGITTSPRPQLISDWMSGGDLPQYVKKYPDADRPVLLSDVANGLNYLHSCSVIHGNLKGSNILVDKSGHARITDFGLTKIIKHPHSVQSASQRHDLPLQWSAPEALREGAYSKEADVFSFGMVVYEVLTGTVPFSGKRSTVAAFEIINGQRPPRQTHPVFSEELWSLVERCWAHDPRLRPEVPEVLDTLLNLVMGLVDRGGEPVQTVPVRTLDLSKEMRVLAERHDNEIKELESMREAMGKEIETLRRQLDEQKTRAQEEADGLRKCIAEIQSKLDEDRHVSACLPQDRSSPHFGDQLNKALRGREYERCVQTLQTDDLVWLFYYLDKALHCLDPSGPASRKCLRELRSLCGTHTTLPASHIIPPHLLTVDPLPFASGGCGEMHRGTLGSTAVCVKRLPVSIWGISSEAKKMFCQEAVVWKYLEHPNILPLLGATISPPQLVSAFMPAGDLSKYVKENPNTDRVGLLSEIAKGLSYLHSRNIIHGDLKGMNILVEVVGGAPRSRIADFGITTVTKNLDSTQPATVQTVHTPRWSAPEVLREENPSRESDIYSFAMIMIEVLSGQVPFSNIKSNYVVVMAVWEGKRPPRPEHPSCSDRLWRLIQRCWAQDPPSRPDIREVSQTFSFVSPN